MALPVLGHAARSATEVFQLHIFNIRTGSVALPQRHGRNSVGPSSECTDRVVCIGTQLDGKTIRPGYEITQFVPCKVNYLNRNHTAPIFKTFTSSSKKGFRSTDNLADLISRIRNGYFRSFEDIIVIDCKETRDLLDAFIYAGYINS